ncbi:MAG: Ig-like domain-containing protein, partial [Sulfurovum sp.]|nr:Ig-like domain-containing protein [Sulfurovum sp.]
MGADREATAIFAPAAAAPGAATTVVSTPAPSPAPSPSPAVPGITPITPAPTVAQRYIDIKEPSGDGVVNSSEVSSITLLGAIEPGSLIERVYITDGANIVEIPTSSLSYNSATGQFRVDGIDVSSLNDGTLRAIVDSITPNETRALYEDTIEKDTIPPAATAELDQIAEDSILNSIEANGTVPITGTVKGEFSSGDEVTVIVNGKEYKGDIDSDGNFSIDVPGSELAADHDGKVEVFVAASDKAGNISTVDSSGTFNVDTTAPSAPAVTIAEDTNDDGYINASELSGDIGVTIALPSDAKVGDTLQITNPDSTTTDVEITRDMIDNGYTVSYESPGEGQSISVSAKVIDAAGNEGASASDSATIDTTAPNITVSAPDSTNDTTPTITGTTDEIGATVHITVTDANGDTQTFTTTVQNDGTYSADVPNALPEGNYDVSATVSDAAGNSATATDNGNTIDTTAPSLSIDLDPVTGDNIINAAEEGSTITLTGSVTGDFKTTDTITVTVNGVDYTTNPAADGSFSVDVSGSELTADSDLTVDASISTTDTAGNTTDASTTETYSVDTTAPSLTVAAPDSTNDTTPTITGTSDEIGATVHITVTDANGDTQTFTTTVQNDGTYSADVPNALPDGSYSVEATVSDAAGNSTTATDNNNIVDTTVPTISVDIKDSSSNDDYIGGDDDLTQTKLSGSVEPGSTIVSLVVTDGTNTINIDPDSITVNSDGTWSTTVDTTSLSDGTVTATLEVQDSSGNSATASDTIVKDTTAPSAPAVTIAEDTNDDGYINASELSGDIGVTIALPSDAK